MQHVLKLPSERDQLIGPVRAVSDRHMLDPLHQLLDLGVGGFEAVVVADNGDILGHRIAKLFVNLVRVLIPRGRRQLLVLSRLLFQRTLEQRRRQIIRALLEVLDVVDNARPGKLPAGQTRQQGVCAKPVRAVVLILRLTNRKQAGNRCLLVARVAFGETAGGFVFREVYPQAAHRIVNCREDPHRGRARVFADELLVDLKNATQFNINLLLVQVSQV